MYDVAELPYRIKRLRGSASQAEFALECGLTQAQISGYELGKNYPTIESLAKVCAARGITMAAFLEEKEPSCAPPRRATNTEMTLWLIEAIGITDFRLDAVRRALIRE